MKLKFYGTSHGVPEADRFTTSVRITAGGREYLIDAGAPIANLLTRDGIPFSAIEAIFLTHLHGDHVDGLVQFIDLCSWYYKNTDPQIFTPDLALENALTVWQQLLFHQSDRLRSFRFTQIEPGEIFRDDAIAVSAIPTLHQVSDLPDYRRRSYAFAMEELATGRRVLFTGDLKSDMCDFPKVGFEAHFDCIVTEGAHGHLDELSGLLAGCRADRMIISHIYPRRNPPERIGALASALPMPVTAAFDGMEIEL